MTDAMREGEHLGWLRHCLRVASARGLRAVSELGVDIWPPHDCVVPSLAIRVDPDC